MKNTIGCVVVKQEDLCFVFRVYFSHRLGKIKIRGSRTDGVVDLVHLSQKAKKHGNCKVHLNNVISLGMLGNVNIATCLSDAYKLTRKLNLIQLNKKIQKNRELLSIIIDCVKFCGSFELPLRGHDETETSKNPGVFR